MSDNIDYERVDQFIDSVRNNKKILTYIKNKIKSIPKNDYLLEMTEKYKNKLLKNEYVIKYDILKKAIDNLELVNKEIQQTSYHLYTYIFVKLNDHHISIQYDGDNEGKGNIDFYWNDICILEDDSYFFTYDDLSDDSKISFHSEYDKSEFNNVNINDFASFLSDFICTLL